MSAADASASQKADATWARIRAALDGLACEESEGRDGVPTLRLEREVVHAALERLKERAGFVAITLVTGTDHLPREPRFEVHHMLLSPESADRVRLTTPLPEKEPRVSTCTDLFPGASFMERECFDMFGIVFDGHPDLRRLMMPDGYDHHPLRKDFPHAGIEPDRLYREWDRERRAAADPSLSPADHAGPGRRSVR